MLSIVRTKHQTLALFFFSRTTCHSSLSVHSSVRTSAPKEETWLHGIVWELQRCTWTMAQPIHGTCGIWHLCRTAAGPRSRTAPTPARLVIAVAHGPRHMGSYGTSRGSGGPAEPRGRPFRTSVLGRGTRLASRTGHAQRWSAPNEHGFSMVAWPWADDGYTDVPKGHEYLFSFFLLYLFYFGIN